MNVSSGYRILEIEMKDTKFKVGDRVTIVVRHNSPLLENVFQDIPKTLTFRGVVLPKEEYDPHDSLRLTSDDPMVDLRVIAFKNILTWNGTPFRFTSHEVKAKAMPDYVIVQGSNANVYRIAIAQDGTKTCSCPGFGFRGRCKHVDQYNADQSRVTSNQNQLF